MDNDIDNDMDLDVNINYKYDFHNNLTDCDDCYSRDIKSCSKCKNCGFCVSGDDNFGICVFGDYRGPIAKPHYVHHNDKLSKNYFSSHINNSTNNIFDNISSYCYKWIYQPDDFTHDSHDFHFSHDSHNMIDKPTVNNINNNKNFSSFIYNSEH